MGRTLTVEGTKELEGWSRTLDKVATLPPLCGNQVVPEVRRQTKETGLPVNTRLAVGLASPTRVGRVGRVGLPNVNPTLFDPTRRVGQVELGRILSGRIVVSRPDNIRSLVLSAS